MGAVTPVVIEAGDEDVEMVDAFSLDGRMYQVPAEPPVGLALLYLTTLREHGESMANQQLLEETLGGEAFRALMRSRSVKADHLKAVIRVVLPLVLGGLESDPNSASG